MFLVQLVYLNYKEDKFERKVEGYLPKADFVFLDEIWKSSPAILNTLLTIINEKVYRNGSQENRVPLKALVAASNETPPKGQGLEAMYDRFIMRLLVKPVEDVDNFNNLIVAEDIKFDANIDSKISTEELEDFKILINEIQVPDNILNIINYIKNEIEQNNKNNENKEPIYISDRRWKNIVYILKTAAFLSDREEVLPVDCFLISHCIWELQEDIDKVKDTVIKAIENFSQINRDKFEDINNKVKDLHKDIDTDCINQENIYKTENINDTKCFKIKIDYYTDTTYQPTLHSKDLYIPRDKINTDGKFYPMIDDGQEFKSFICSFGGNTVLKVKVYNEYKSLEKEYDIIQASINHPITSKNIQEQFLKTNNYNYEVDNIEINMDNDIFTTYIFARLSCQYELDRTWNFEPQLSHCHTGCNICCSDTCRKCTKCTVCTCMGICTDNHISRNRKSFFRKECMLYSHFTYIKIVCNIIFAGKLTHAFAMLCGFNVLIWSKVIHHKCDLVFVKYTLYIHFSDFMNCNRRSNIIAQNQIQVCLDQLSGADRRQACMCCKNLLSHCHSHG